jgi:hypothetical protein
LVLVIGDNSKRNSYTEIDWKQDPRVLELHELLFGRAVENQIEAGIQRDRVPNLRSESPLNSQELGLIIPDPRIVNEIRGAQ